MFFEVRYTQLCVCVCLCVMNWRICSRQSLFSSSSATGGSSGSHTDTPPPFLPLSLSLCLTETHAHSHWHTQNHPSSVWKILKALTLLLFGVIECRTTLSHSLIPSLFFSFIPLFAPSLSLNLTSLCTLTLNLRSPALYSHHTSAFSTALSPSCLSLTFNPTSSHVWSLTHTHTQTSPTRYQSWSLWAVLFP